MQHQTETYEGDFSWKDFVTMIYKTDPKPAHSYSVTFLDDIPSKDLPQYLGYFIVYGSKTLFGKELAALTPDQITQLRKYLASIGWNVEYKVDTVTSPSGTVTNNFKIEFFPAKHDALEDPNRATRMAV
jgi:hypothetical protein